MYILFICLGYRESRRSLKIIYIFVNFLHYWSECPIVNTAPGNNTILHLFVNRSDPAQASSEKRRTLMCRILAMHSAWQPLV